MAKRTPCKDELAMEKKTLVWIDNWLYDGKPCRSGGRLSLMNINLKASDIINPTIRNWDLTILHELFSHDDLVLIRSLRPAVFQEDEYTWVKTKNGVYTVQSGYELSSRQKHAELYRQADQQPSINPILASVWQVKIVPKIQVFLWKALNGSLAVYHILFECPLARQVWALSNVPAPANGFGVYIRSNIHYLMQVAANRDVPEKIRLDPVDFVGKSKQMLVQRKTISD